MPRQHVGRIGFCLLLLGGTLAGPFPGPVIGTAWGQQQAASSVRVRTGVHPTFTRIVFDWPEPVAVTISQYGETAELRFARPARLDARALARPLRNLVGAQAGADGVVLTLAPGVRLRQSTFGPAVVLDLLDPPPGTPAATPAIPAPATSATVPPATAPAPQAAAAVPVPPAPIASPVTAPMAAPVAAPVAPPVAAPVVAPAVPRPPAIAAPAPAQPVAIPAVPAPPVVAPPEAEPSAGLEEPGPVRLPMTSAATSVMRGDSLMLVLENARPADIESIRRLGPALAGAEFVEMPGALGLRLPGAEPGAPPTLGFSAQPTRLGVALSLVPDAGLATAAAPAPTRLLNLRDEPEAALLARWRGLLGRTAAAPPASRDSLRIEMAETLLSLGLGLEAQAALQLALAGDPDRAPEPQSLLLAGATALVAGRLEEAREALSDPRLPPSGEAALWRGILAMQQDGSVADPAFREALALIPSYPAPLRARLLPALAAGLADGGALREARQLLDRAGDAATLPLARYAWARLLEARGEAEPAILAYTGLTEGRDRDARARALGRLAELRLATGRIDQAAAADALESAIVAWRGDGRELARRQRAATLRIDAGQHGAALTLLAETAASFPEAADALRAPLRTARIAVITDPASPPLDAARLHAQHHATLAPDPRLDAAVMRIADRLLALEMPSEASTLLRNALPGSADAGGLVVRLAEARLAEGDAAGALQALSTGAGGAALPGELGLRRALAEATARQQLGDRAGAAGILRGLGPEGAAPLAEVLAAGQDWAGAAEALGRHLARSAPGTAELDSAARRDLLRQAAFLALANDQEGLSALRDRYAARLPGGAFNEAFTAMAAGTPGALDLSRLRQEIAGARALHDQARALR